MLNVQDAMVMVKMIKRVLTMAIRIYKKIFAKKIPLAVNNKRTIILVEVNVIVVSYI